MPTPDDRTTVVVAPRNRAPLLALTLSRLTALPEQPRIIVVDNNSTDETSQVARGAGVQVRVITLTENRAAAGRNVGVESATSPYVAFCDDDSWFAPDSLAHAANLMDGHPRLALIAARILVGAKGEIDPTCAQMAVSPLAANGSLPGPAVLGFLACGAVVRRSAFLEVGGFLADFGIGGEEGLLAIDLAAAGWNLPYVEQVTAYHHPPPRDDHCYCSRLQVRNDLWLAWMRRRLPGAFRRSITLFRRHLAHPAGRRGF